MRDDTKHIHWQCRENVAHLAREECRLNEELYRYRLLAVVDMEWETDCESVSNEIASFVKRVAIGEMLRTRRMLRFIACC